MWYKEEDLLTVSTYCFMISRRDLLPGIIGMWLYRLSAFGEGHVGWPGGHFEQTNGYVFERAAIVYAGTFCTTFRVSDENRPCCPGGILRDGQVLRFFPGQTHAIQKDGRD